MVVRCALTTAVLWLSGCSWSAAFQWHRVSIGSQGTRCLPVAFTLAAQERGLQGVKRVTRPMVFAYSPPSSPSYWMQDTPAPLTGVWVGAGKRVIGYWHGQPESTALHPAPAPVAAVIEYPAGARVPPRGARYALGRACRAQPGGL
jgi:uncharacterized membrane protein (UPF0127 family)